MTRIMRAMDMHAMDMHRTGQLEAASSWPLTIGSTAALDKLRHRRRFTPGKTGR